LLATERLCKAPVAQRFHATSSILNPDELMQQAVNRSDRFNLYYVGYSYWMTNIKMLDWLAPVRPAAKW
jgi:hypothetical protein